MNIATLRAIMDGDLKNAMVASTPGGIEAQEAQGQRDFVANENLPIEINRGSREELEEMGITFGNHIDDLFVEVELPEGWHKVATDHSMWSDLIDDKGRKRASIFYKAAFYDRSAHISLVRRYSYSVDPVCGWGDPEYKSHNWHCVVKDGNDIIWKSEEQVGPEPDDREARLVWYNERDKLSSLGKDYLYSNFPDWESYTAYWD